MDLRSWQQLYARAERAARAYFAEHFSDLCARCFEAAAARADPAFCCCQRTNFLTEILTDPLCGGLAEESLGHSLLPLCSSVAGRGCSALGPEGCRIPFGRPDLCNSYVCEWIYECERAVLSPELLCRMEEGLDVFLAIREAREQRAPTMAPCEAQVAHLEAAFDAATTRLRQEDGRLLAVKLAAMRAMFPPEVPR